MDELTTTSYAILGLLAIRPWTTYELARQMRRSMRHLWPRAESRIYAEPKRLADLGLARAKSEHVGRRPRTTYAITAKGRRALTAWLAQPGKGPTIEFDALLRVFFAEHARRADVLANIDVIRAWAEEQIAENVAFARLYTETGGPFPDRLASITLIGKFVSDFADMLAAWAQWASAEVARWPDAGPAEPDWSVLRAIAARDVVPAPLP